MIERAALARTRSRARRAVAVLGVGLIAAVSVGCGVSVQDEADSLPSGALPALAATPSASPTTQKTPIYFVSGRNLDPVDEALSDRSVDGVMEALASAPPVDRQAELRTLLIDPLTQTPLLSVSSQPVAGQLVVARTDAFNQMPASDQVLLVGQVVLSMADIGISSVVITDSAGVQVPVVLPDGRIVDGPAVPADYEELVLK